MESIIGTKNIEALQKKYQNFGYFHWAQLQLGTKIIEIGVAETKKEILTEATLQDSNVQTPHFIPSRKRICRVAPEFSSVPILHKLVHIKEIKIYDENRNCTGTHGRNYCLVCKQKSK